MKYYNLERKAGLKSRILMNIAMMRAHLDALEGSVGQVDSLSQMAQSVLVNGVMLLSDCGAFDEVKYRESMGE